MAADPRPRVAFAMSRHAFAEAFAEAAIVRLESAVDVVGPRPIEDLSSAEARRVLAETDVLITGWSAPRIDAGVLDAAPRLRAIVHAAGTVKTFMSRDPFDRGIRVSTSAAANAVPVAEFTVASIVLGLKRAKRFMSALSLTHGVRDASGMPPLGVNGVTIGLVGASRVGREVVRLLRAFDVEVLVSDPFLDDDEATRLGVRRVGLDELCRLSDVVSLHAPLTPDTVGMIGAEQLALLGDGALVVNTARGRLIDTAALTRELVSGRLDACLDVVDPEPLPADSPLYDLPNVGLTPHIAGAMGNEVRRLGDMAVDEVLSFVSTGGFAHEIRPGDLARIA